MGQHDLPHRFISTNGLNREPPSDPLFDLTTDQFMNSSTDPAQPNPPHGQGTIPFNLAAQASDPNADECGIAEAVMPDLVIGDLAPDDAEWVRNHTITCNYCSNILHSLENVCSSLDECADDVAQRTSHRRPSATVCLGIPEARYGFMETPVGDVLVAASDEGVVEVSYLEHNGAFESLRELERRGYLVYERQDTVRPVIDQLGEYFDHERREFDLQFDLSGVTDFTRAVLEATSRIPYGKVRTYGDVANEIGKPKASRAVGNALGRNPIPVIIPCHRVILSSGAMGWYTGGPEIKRALLGIEGVPYGARQQTNQQSLSLEI
jgi:methylated-DNA-[protein]-cysteine S-methyltransferase